MLSAQAHTAQSSLLLVCRACSSASSSPSFSLLLGLSPLSQVPEDTPSHGRRPAAVGPCPGVGQGPPAFRASWACGGLSRPVLWPRPSLPPWSAGDDALVLRGQERPGKAVGTLPRIKPRV